MNTAGNIDCRLTMIEMFKRGNSTSEKIHIMNRMDAKGAEMK